MKPSDYEFNVGDKVVTVLGEVGHIVDICKCDYCEMRGFFEPYWVDDSTGQKNYIMIADAECEFSDYYQIGKYRFDNVLRKKAVMLDIEHCERELNAYKKRLAVIEELEKEV